MHYSVLLFLPLVVSVIIGIMFGWEIGFGVAFLVGAISLFIADQFVWGSVALVLAVGLAISSLLRIHGVIGVTIKTWDLQVRYFDWADRGGSGQPNEYHFSGIIEVKTSTAVAIRDLYLEVLIKDTKVRANLMSDFDGFCQGHVLSPSKPLVKQIAFQWVSTKRVSLPTIATMYFNTTEWERHKTVRLVGEADT